MPNDPIFFDRTTFEAAQDLSRSIRETNPRRAALTETIFTFHRALFRLNQAARAIDDVAFPGYRDAEIERPIYIVANPRSGTTFLHRLMCLDHQFFYLKLFHTLFPAVSLFKIIDAASDTDSVFSRLLETGIDAFEDRFFGAWEDIHPLGFDRAEEDEGLFVLTLLSPGLYLLFPEISKLPRPSAVDDLSGETRRRVMDFYESCLKRVKFVEGRHKTFLGKTVLVPGRFQSLLDRFPRARFVQLVRHPYKTVPSFVSMFRLPWRSFAPEIEDRSPQTRQLADLAIDYYRRSFEARKRVDDDHMMTVRFDNLVAEPKKHIERIYDWLDYDITPSFEYNLDAELRSRREYSSSHEYSLEQFGLTRGEIYGRLRDVFEYHGFEP